VKDGCGSILGAYRRQGPSGGIQHAHSALTIDHYDQILIGVALKGGVQNVLCLP